MSSHTPPGEQAPSGRRTRRVLLSTVAALGLATAAAAGVLALSGSPSPELPDPAPTAAATETSRTAAAPKQQPSATTTAAAPVTPTEHSTTHPPGESSATGTTQAPTQTGDDTDVVVATEPAATPTTTQAPAQTEATEEPDEPATATATATAPEQDAGQIRQEPFAECSTGAYSPGPPPTDGLPPAVAATASSLLTDAMECDARELIARAELDGTSLSFGSSSAQDALGIPQEDPRYLAMAVLLTNTGWAVDDTGASPVYVWPAAALPDATEEDWLDLRQAGVHDPDLLAQMHRNGFYTGWRVGITENGQWRFLIAGD